MRSPFTRRGRFATYFRDRTMSNDAPQKKRPMGPAIEWTDDDLEKLAAITPADERRASARATEDMRALVNAETVDPDEQ